MKTHARYSFIVLHLISIMLMILGWTLPILSIDIFVDVPILGKYYFLQETRSILSTLEKLFGNGNWLPAALILLFGVMVPVMKSVYIFAFLFSTKPFEKEKKFINKISKWAMADVFAMGILIAFLAANNLKQTQANFRTGFYCFTAYCIISTLVAQLLSRASSPSES